MFSQEDNDDFSYIISSFNLELSETESQELEELYSNKFDINNENFEAYEQLFFLTDFQKKSLFVYVKKHKPIVSKYEFQYILGFDDQSAQLLSYICILKPIVYKTTFAGLFTNGSHTVSHLYSWYPISMREYNNYFDYSGQPVKSVHRYRYKAYNKLYWGFTAKNDMGEPEQKGPFSTTFDYTSAYIHLKSYKHFNHILLGDYDVKIGQGLALWQGGFYGVINGQSRGKYQTVFSKHSASNEWAFMRGCALSYNIKKINAFAFVSSKKTDGHITDSVKPFSIPIQFYETGYHKSTTEQKYEDAIQQFTWGGGITQSKNHIQTQICVIENLFHVNLQSYNIFNSSFSYSYVVPQLRIYGEHSFDKYMQSAHIAGIDYTVKENIDCGLRIRNIGQTYQSFQSNPSIQNANNEDERGVDYFMRYKINAFILSLSNDIYTKISEKNIFSKTSFQAIWSEYSRYTNNIKIDYYKDEALRIKIKLQSTYFAISKTRLQMQFCKTITPQDQINKGYAANVNCKWNSNQKLSVQVSYSIFDAPYFAYIYFYDPNVQYGITNSQMLYAGSRINTICKIQISKNCALQFRASITKYSNKYELPEYYKSFGSSCKIVYDTLIKWKL